MNTTHLLMFPLVISILASCAHAPRAPRDSESLHAIRTQYLAEHPDGRYNDQISRGELAKGMNVIEVLASWGLPEDRREEPQLAREVWRYATRDGLDTDVTVYELIFEHRRLNDWVTERHVTGAGGTAVRSATQAPDAMTLDTKRSYSGDAPRK